MISRSGKISKRKREEDGRHLSFLALLITIAFLFGGCGKEAEPPSEESTVISPEKSVVQVKAGNTVGSALLRGVNAEGNEIILLTAGHVLENLSAGEYPIVVLDDGTEVPCDSYQNSESTDVAVLTIEDTELAEKLQRENCFIKEDRERFDSMQDGDSCIAIGGDADGGKSVCTGEILDNWIYMEDYAQYMIWAEVEIHPGMSGGGLFDSEGYFLGILSGGSEDGQLAAVPLSLILSEFHNSLD